MTSTAHSTWIYRGVAAVMLAGVVCGPAALVMSVRDAPPAPTEVTPAITDERQLARETASHFGLRAVTTWLTTTQDTTEATQAMFRDAIGRQGFPREESQQIRNGSVVHAQPLDDSGAAWMVLISVDIRVPGEDDTERWDRQHYEIPVRVDGAEAIAYRAPSLVPAPAIAEAGRSAYTESVPSSSPVYATASAFLAALLAGEGDTARLTSPQSEIPAVSPAPFVSVAVTDVTSTGDIPDEPASGDQAHILISAEGSTAGEVTVPLQYSVRLSARDGRWEVAEISDPPLVDESRLVYSADPEPAEPTETEGEE